MADCPYCLQPGAQRFLWLVRCPNSGCPKYDEQLQKAQARALIRPRKEGETRKGPLEQPPVIMEPAGPGSALRTLRTALGWLLILGAAAVWLGDKAGYFASDPASGYFQTGVKPKHLIWIGLAGFWILPRKPKAPPEPQEDE